MSRPADPEAYLHLPDCPDTDAVRAGLMAMKCIPSNLPLQAAQRQAALQQIAQGPASFLIIDVSNLRPQAAESLMAVCNYLPMELRPQTLLTRLVGGHVCEEERAWAKSLGFLDLVAELDMNDPSGGLRIAMDSAARLLDLASPSAQLLARYVAAANTKTLPKVAPRALIRAHTQLSAEKLAELLQNKLAIQDRSYHFKKYPSCFVASEAVAWMAKKLQIQPPVAVAVGQALGELGLLFHVEQKHSFANEPWFFRLAVSPSAGQTPNTLAIDTAIQVLREKTQVADRTYLGTAYPKCWVGSQAVDALCNHQTMPRHQAHLILHRLMMSGLFRHVVNEQPFVDGNFYYRFNG